MPDPDVAWIATPVPLGKPVQVVVKKRGSGFSVVCDGLGKTEKKVSTADLFDSFEEALESLAIKLSDQVNEASKKLAAAMRAQSALQDLCVDSAAQIPDRLRAINGIREWSVWDSGPGVYVLCLAGEIVYVGQSQNMAERVRKHASDKFFDAVFCVDVGRGMPMHVVESVLIGALEPPLNVHQSPLGSRAKVDPRLSVLTSQVMKPERVA